MEALAASREREAPSRGLSGWRIMATRSGRGEETWRRMERARWVAPTTYSGLVTRVHTEVWEVAPGQDREAWW